MMDLRIMRLSYDPPEIRELGYGYMFEKLKEVTIMTPLMQTFERFILVCEVVWKDAPDMDFLSEVKLVEKAEVISQEGNVSLMMVSGKFPEIYTGVIREFFETFNCFIEFPATFTEKGMFGSIVGSSKDLNRFLEFAKVWGAEYEVRSVKKYQPSVKGALSNLTPRQYLCLKTAVSSGYFDVPRRISSRELGSAMGLSHATVLEHLKKAQREVLTSMFKE